MDTLRDLFMKKRAFIPLSRFIAGGKSLTLRTCKGSVARADDAKVVCSRDTQCNTKESP